MQSAELPQNAMLRRYVADGHYTDCFSTRLPVEVTFERYVVAFYSTLLFRAERLVLRLLSLPSTDEQLRQLAAGDTESFAAWTVEDRGHDQLLLTDVRQRTGSWFMLDPGGAGSRLYFGSVVFATEEAPSGPRPGWAYRALLGLHRVYSRALLGSAGRKLIRARD